MNRPIASTRPCFPRCRLAYSMLWFVSLLLVWTTLALGTAIKRGRLSLLWGIVAGAGLLTYYFFAFVWLACSGWLRLHPKHRRLAIAATATGSSALIAASWYWRLAESLGRWPVTAGWLDEPLALPDTLSAPFKMVWAFVSGGVNWKSGRPASSQGMARGSRSRHLEPSRGLYLRAYLRSCLRRVLLSLSRRCYSFSLRRRRGATVIALTHDPAALGGRRSAVLTSRMHCS